MTLLHLSSQRTAAIAAVLSVIVLALRVPDAFSTPQLFAEDGNLFWLASLSGRARRGLHDVSGYLHLAPRPNRSDRVVVRSWVGPVIFHTVVVLLTAWASGDRRSHGPQPLGWGPMLRLSLTDTLPTPGSERSLPALPMCSG